MNSDTTQLEHDISRMLASDMQHAVDSGALSRDAMNTMRELRDSYEALAGPVCDPRGRPI